MNNKDNTQNYKNVRVAVAMSGGVDSSVAAALCVEKYGQENAFGITMRLFCYAQNTMQQKSCCSLKSINDAKAVCQKLGIKHYVLDFEKEFEKKVIQDFVQSYLKGKTPNPCIRCNQFIKFDGLLKKARGLGADFLATGHYSLKREIKNPPTLRSGSRSDVGKKSQPKADEPLAQKFKTQKLLKGVDKKKDQSYFLYSLTQDQLKHILFPLGDLKKEETRKIALRLGLKTAEKIESQEICFVNDTNYHEFLRSRIDTNRKQHKLPRIKEGEIVDLKGNVLGGHQGLAFYTIGQRKGLGISSKNPLYVIRIDIKNNQLVVGKEKDLYSKSLITNQVNWVLGQEPHLPLKAKAKIRYQAKEEECIISCQLSAVNCQLYKVEFQKPQRAITPGQSVVFYCQNEILGGGIIKS